MLTEMEDRLSAVTRWGIIRTLQKQTVADHSYRVTLLAEKVARDWFGLNTPNDLYSVLRYALDHDKIEAVSGDFPSIIKDVVNEKELERRYADVIHITSPSDMAKNCVKIADRIEAIIFLRLEVALGNTTVQHVIDDVKESLRDYLSKMGRPDLWDRYVEEVEYSGWASTGMVCHPLNRRPK